MTHYTHVLQVCRYSTYYNNTTMHARSHALACTRTVITAFYRVLFVYMAYGTGSVYAGYRDIEGVQRV